ncbi:MAG TPA: hypothetical protein DEP69_06405, partial [Acidimicrobiaceae bacterium]|nr:hypothetical protein [Acidimicrobiaceae bacterium]
METYACALDAHRRTIDLLNVYPVPDGDTGTNMALTLVAVREALRDVDAGNAAAVCGAISTGALMGARGNSGVIISQFLRAMVSVLAEAPERTGGEIGGEIGGGRLAAALTAG